MRSRFEQFNLDLKEETINVSFNNETKECKKYVQYADVYGSETFLTASSKSKFLVPNYSYVKKGQPIIELEWWAWHDEKFIVTSKRDGYVYFFIQEFDFGWGCKNDELIIQHNMPVYFVTDDVMLINKMKQIDYAVAERMKKPVVKVEQKCYLYIMRDDYNGAYKIGIANNPKKREKTLQSDKPSITLHKCVEFKNRNEAYKAEQYLHKVFESQRWKRSDGKVSEWFKLGSNDLTWIYSKWSWKNVA